MTYTARQKNVSLKWAIVLSCLLHLGVGIYFVKHNVVHVTNTVSVLHVKIANAPTTSSPKSAMAPSPVLSKTLIDKSVRDERVEQKRTAMMPPQETSSTENTSSELPSFTWEDNPQPIEERKQFFVYPQHYNNILAFTLESHQMVVLTVKVDQERIQTYTFEQGMVKDIENFDKLLKFFPVMVSPGTYMLYLSKEEYLQSNCETTTDSNLTALCSHFQKELINHSDYFKEKTASTPL